MKSKVTSPKSKSGRPVVVRVCDEDHSQPSEMFHLCPLGLQFHSKKPLREFDLFEFNLDLDKKQKGRSKVPLKCTGAVVRCLQEEKSDRYRVWIQFLDLPKGTREKIKCVSKDGQHLCCYCENF
jgi:hypothetical protein